MSVAPTEPVPLMRDETGTIRVAGTRITLDTVLAAFLDGATPEQISDSYSALSLADIYAVISYYLRHRGEVETYLAEGHAEAEEHRRFFDSRLDRAKLRERLLARRQTGERIMLDLLADENFNGSIVRGLRRRRADASIVTVYDVGLEHADDSAVLAWAAEHRYVVVSHDLRTMPRFIRERMASGLPVPGVVLTSQKLPIGSVIEDLLLLIECSAESELRSQVIYLPL